MGRRLGLGALLVTVGLLAGACASSREVTTVPPTDVDTPTTTVPEGEGDRSDGPSWYLAGIEAGRARLAADRERRERTAAPTTTTRPAPALPPRSQFVSALSSFGLGPASAGCIYDNLSSGGATDDANAVFQILSATTGAGIPDAAAIAAVQQLDPGASKRIIVALSPCLDTTTLLTLLAQTGGLGPVDLGPMGAAGLAGLVSSLGNANLAPLQTNAPQLANLAGARLPAPQLAALQAYLAAVASNALQAFDPSAFDISALDLENLTNEQIGMLFAALARGLNEEQRSQLQTLARVDLSRLGLEIDYSQLSAEQAGALLVLFLPFLATSLDPASGQPPKGWDPSQVYIPPGTDLSQINPLYFVPKENVVLGLEREGIPPRLGGCLYDELRLIDPQLIGLAFTGDNLTAAGQVLLAVFGCMLR